VGKVVKRDSRCGARSLVNHPFTNARLPICGIAAMAEPLDHGGFFIVAERPEAIPKMGLIPASSPNLAALSLRALAIVFPDHRRKRIAHRFGVALNTAKTWLIDGVPQRRREELAAVIEAEIPRLEREIDELEAIEGELRGGAQVAHVAHRARDRLVAAAATGGCA
jgi:hypothetical protein